MGGRRQWHARALTWVLGGSSKHRELAGLTVIAAPHTATIRRVHGARAGARDAPGMVLPPLWPLRLLRCRPLLGKAGVCVECVFASAETGAAWVRVLPLPASTACGPCSCAASCQHRGGVFLCVGGVRRGALAVACSYLLGMIGRFDGGFGSSTGFRQGFSHPALDSFIPQSSGPVVPWLDVSR